MSFDVRAGSTFGIVGRNGSGKSTMLKLVAGITKPTTRHRARCNGRISALIELGAGFHPEISGRENVFINGIMLGLSKREITRRFDEIVEFAELQDFIDAPVKTYSSGMYMRLGFAVAIHVDPDVLLIDEVLAVGDESFTHKCLDKFAEFRRRGKTILLVTHSLNLVERFCDEALWLDDGQVARAGRSAARRVGLHHRRREDRGAPPRRDRGQGAGRPWRQAIREIRRSADQGESEAPTAGGSGDAESTRTTVEPASDRAPADMFQAGEGRWGSREAEITDVQLIGEDGQPAHVFFSGERVDVHLQHPRAQAADGLRRGHRPLQRRRRVLLRHEHGSSRS